MLCELQCNKMIFNNFICVVFQLRHYARPDYIALGYVNYSLDVCIKMFDFFETYFDFPFEMPKEGKITQILSSIVLWTWINVYASYTLIQYRLQDKFTCVNRKICYMQSYVDIVSMDVRSGHCAMSFQACDVIMSLWVILNVIVTA